MYLHYNSDGSIKAVINLKGKKIKMTFDSVEDYNSFLAVIF